ncbi:heavy metal translocating P-type ATPase metal-binding domain-containing protein [Telluribacter sp. SYSU D00476]|uniref:heavy metal translocating P-type ATPase n=1 Tax=Telluribacter sp. SYSU D00476 TaxID=2811430 RepID=UPI001FF15216|nr:heavy metal translocating P-type ATPase metal-binding domain-containing protein [Telluribacter sp. SYSU D00476]
MKESTLAPEPVVQEIHTCYHCGEPCRDEILPHDSHEFCCEGCKLVYDVLKENDLCQYYAFDDAKGNSPESTYYQGKFDYLDLPDVQPKLLEFTDGRQSRINWLVPKMHCSSCIWLLEKLDHLHPGVSGSVVNFPEKKVRVSFYPDKIKLSELAELLTKIGYEPYISLNDVEGKAGNKWNRTRLYKMGIAGFSFANIMMLSLPEYFHLGQTSEDQNLRVLFSALNVVLALPVFFYSASDFFVSAWKALRGRYLNIDAPISLALWSVFLTSLYQILSETGPGYLDSLTGSIFFLLIGRYFQDRTYASISFDRDYKSYFPVAVAVLKEGVETRLPITDLRPGDHMIVRNRELIPADAVLVSPQAMIDYSFVSGEAEPVERRKGDTIYAGGRQSGTAVEMEVLRRVSQSYLTQLWNNDAFTRKKEDENQTLAARFNRYFSSIVLVIATLTFTYWMYTEESFALAFTSFTAVLIVACPCALTLSATFTNGNMLSLFGKYRFYLKNAFAIERLAKIDTVVFDKTGTITLASEAEVTFEGEPLSADEQVMIKTLAAQSSHPLSRLLVQCLPEVTLSRRVLSDFEEIEGAGTRALWGRYQVQLGSARWVGIDTFDGDSHNASRVYVSVDGLVRGFFSIRSKYRPELAQSVVSLREDGYNLYLLSGDKPTDQSYLSTLFGSTSRLFFRQHPDEKLAFIQKMQKDGKRVLMVGDGLNDAGALRQSEVGLAVSDDVNNFSPACDAIIEGERLADLPRYIRMARAGQRVIKLSFALSLVYNIIGLTFAVTGNLTPVLAAILMPVSSIIIVLFTTGATNLAARKCMKK